MKTERIEINKNNNIQRPNVPAPQTPSKFRRCNTLFYQGLNSATRTASCSGGGGSTSDMPWQEKDEDYLHWTRRAMLYAHAKHYPSNKFRKSKGY